MIVTKPDYYDSFRCLAGLCPDSCCKEWSVQVDEASAAYYRSLPGVLGDRLRQVLVEEDGQTVMEIQDGRCPMWRQDGLCRIQCELGEEALCRVCADFPRLRHDYGSRVELGLELSCPEAARLILSSPDRVCTEIQPDTDTESVDEEALASLLASREIALTMTYDAVPGRGLALLLLYGCQAQEELDGAEPQPFDAAAAMDTILEIKRPGNLEDFLAFFRELEILTPAWKSLLDSPAAPRLPQQTGALARCLIRRYWLQAVADYDLMSRVKFICIACLLVGSLGGSYPETAQLFSKEIENDADNVDAILDAAYTHRAFTDDRLLGLLMSAAK